MKRLLTLLCMILILAISLPTYSDELTESSNDLTVTMQTQALDQMDKGFMLGNDDGTDTLLFITKDGKYFEFIMSKGDIVRAYEINKERYDDWRKQQVG